MDTLKSKFSEKALPLAQELKSFVKEHGNVVVGQYTIDQVVGGMKGIKGLLTETSVLDAVEGIRFRGYNITQLRELLPKAEGDTEPLPEGIFYLMLIGELPTPEDVAFISQEWNRRANIPQHVFDTLEALPATTHPMTQFSIGILAMQTESEFAAGYAKGIGKDTYWQHTYEDAMNLIARLPRLAAYIYRRSFHNGNHIAPDPSLDWAGNFAHMLGIDTPSFKSLMRLYLTIHADHEGGNGSAHTVHLTGSMLSDAYLSFSSGMNSLAGPLHGLANQEVISWIFKMQKTLGTQTPTKEQVEEYIRQTLANKQVVPGYGHAVLRRTDPRFLAQQDFAKKHFPDDPLCNLVWNVYDVAPRILGETGKIQNPFPNVDAHSGALLLHYGFKEYSFYTVLFGVSRALGVMASLCWSRAYGLGLERPGSVTFAKLKEIAEKAANPTPA